MQTAATEPRPHSAVRTSAAELRRYPKRTTIIETETWVLYGAEQRDGAYLIFDLRPLAGLLGPENVRLLRGLVEVLRFEDPGHRARYLEHAGLRRLNASG